MALGDGKAARREPLPRWTVVAVGAVVFAITLAGLVVLLMWTDRLVVADADKAAAVKVDAVKVAASIAVGGGGLFALYLTARRQRIQVLELQARHEELAQRDRAQAHLERETESARQHAERLAKASEQDALARRVTDLYTKAVDQIGSDKAPVRLGGLYALERLAQDNPDQRQTVVNVLCAYLRMPFAATFARQEDDTDADVAAFHRERVQGREVRLTAQGILATHLDPGPEPDDPVLTYWEGVDLDLNGAVLIDFALPYCRVGTARFDRATFVGIAKFDGTVFLPERTVQRCELRGRSPLQRCRVPEALLLRRHEIRAGHGLRGHRVRC